jgi:hypothetical protein
MQTNGFAVEASCPHATWPFCWQLLIDELWYACAQLPPVELHASLQLRPMVVIKISQVEPDEQTLPTLEYPEQAPASGVVPLSTLLQNPSDPKFGSKGMQGPPGHSAGVQQNVVHTPGAPVHVSFGAQYGPVALLQAPPSWTPSFGRQASRGFV